MRDGEKTFTFGKVAYNGKRRINAVDVYMSLSDSDNNDGRQVLSIHAGIWNATKTDYVMCGQCLDWIDEHYENIHKDPLFKKLYHLWSLYHLNDLSPGTEKQMKALKEARYDKCNYDVQCEYLKNINLYDDDGYIYGSQWLYRAIPVDVIKEIKSLMAS